MLYSIEKEYNEVDIAGPIARAAETVVCESPLVAPNERLFGAEAVTYMKMHPTRENDIRFLLKNFTSDEATYHRQYP